MIIGYLRVSTEDQSVNRQIDALEAVCDRIYIEKYSARNQNRPVFQRLLTSLKAGDTLAVTSIDRAFRSTVDAIDRVEELKARGITFRILNLAVDTGTADGLFAYTVVAAVATHERMRISERTIQGLKAARKRGKRLGRPPKLAKWQLRAAAARLRDSDDSMATVAAHFGVAAWTLSRALRRRGLGGNNDTG